MPSAPAPSPGPRPEPSSRCWTVLAPDGARDVEVVAGDQEPLAAVLPELARLLGTGPAVLWSGSTSLAPDLPLSAAELRHGALLGWGRPGPRTGTEDRSGALELHVTGGPDAGRALPLTLGPHLIGRASDSAVPLADPDVSRRHALVAVGGGAISVADLGSTNGTLLDGEELDAAPVAWQAGGVLRLGATSLTVRGPQSRPVATAPSAGGRVVVRPASAQAPARPEVEVTLPAAPAPPPRRRLAWAAVSLPAAGGVVMALVLHAPQYLFFAGLSPLVAVGGWFSDRWSGRRGHRREVAAHAAALRAAEARLAEAVAADRRAAEAAAPDLATVTSAARRWSAPLWSRRAEDAHALTVRLGTARRPTRVVRRRGDGTPTREQLPDLPVVVDLRTEGGLAVAAPRGIALGVLASVAAQLAVLHPPGDLDLVLLTDSERIGDWAWARWLPHLQVLSTPEEADAWGAALAGLQKQPRGARPRRWTVVLVDGEPPAALPARLREAREAGVLVVATAPTTEALPATGGALLCATGEVGSTCTLHRSDGADEGRVLTDRLAAEVAALLARDLAALRVPEEDGHLPRSVRLLDLPGPSLRLDTGSGVSGGWSRDRRSLVAVLGAAADGPAVVDLCTAGPHALVAGTTGAGKSELLQTLVTSLALNHPPDRCSFLLVDYKGGAAFAEAADLPHTVGLLTDLDAATTSRALRSLSAELTRRETLLAAHRVADIADLPATADLARLVIVVDEFAGLAEDLPGFVPGLIGIAQRGRSLGVHLVLATQRPGGVVSPEIRANCTLRICLRTTDEADSRDVLGLPDAAFLPLGLPGRAHLRAGSGALTTLQVARVSVPGDAATTGVVLRPWSWPTPGVAAADLPRPTGPSDLGRVAAALREEAARSGVTPPHRPWLTPLPDRLTAADVPLPSRAGRLVLGVVDLPASQTQAPLELDLAEGGGWLAVGGPRSGRTTFLRAVLASAVAGHGPEDLHVHVLDHGGGGLLSTASGLPHSGTVVGGDDPLRTVRLLDRLTAEVGVRRSGGARAARPALLLLVDGVDALMSQLDDADPARGSGAFLRLVRDGAAAGLTTVLTGDRAVPGGRLAAAVRERLVLPLPDRADYAVAGIPPAAVPERRPPGRALLGEGALEAQLVLAPSVLCTAPPVAACSASTGGPLRIAELPPDPELTPTPDGLRVQVGPGGDEGHPLAVDLARSGGLLVVGPPGSGRTGTLDALAGDLASAGVPVLTVSHRPTEGSAPRWLAPDDLPGFAAWLDGLADSTGVLLADDLGPAQEWPVIGALPSGARAGQVVLVAAGTAGDLAGHYQGPVARLRRARSGVLLCPGPGEADLLGIRLPRTPVAVRPGSGWLVSGAAPVRVQVARRRSAHSSSTSGPISCVAYQASS